MEGNVRWISEKGGDMHVASQIEGFSVCVKP